MFRNILIVISISLFITSCGPAKDSTTATPSVNDTVTAPEATADVEFPDEIPASRILRNEVFKENIKTVQIHLNGLELSMPIITLRSGDQVKLSFDDMSGSAQNYYYRVLLCNYDWTPADISTFDYIEGFAENSLTNYQYSYNTLTEYTHYSLLLPNTDIQLTKSGNYVVQVYENNDPEDIVLTQRFMVVDRKVQVLGDITRAVPLEYRNTHQDVEFTVLHKGIVINNPFQDVNVTVIQNQNWGNAVTGIRPKFVKDEALVYDYDQELLFPAIKEFRWFDIQSIRYQKERIKLIESYAGVTHVYVAPDDVRSFESYFYERDINGQYIIDVDEYPNEALQSDYVNVHFTLPFKAALNKGSIYIYGELTGWETPSRAKMIYNHNRKAYEAVLQLKQGYYNYVYAYREGAGAELDFGFIEGNYFETENNYTILVYYRPFGSRWDQLIGVETINSLF